MNVETPAVLNAPAVLRDKVALVFGAGSSRPGLSIGKATSIAFARAGAKVVAVDIDDGAAQDVQSAIRAEGGSCEAVVADVTDSESVKRAVDAAMARFGRIDVLQNNVGVAHVGGPVEMSEETWLASMNVNVGSAFLTCKHVLPIMEAQGGGAITNISSISGQRWVGVPMIGYAAFKAALNNFTQNVALQYARAGVRANVVVVGRMDTPILRASLGSLYDSDEALIADKSSICPTGKLGEPWDVAAASIYLASDAAKYVTGVLLPVDGGVLCQS